MRTLVLNASRSARRSLSNQARHVRQTGLVTIAAATCSVLALIVAPSIASAALPLTFTTQLQLRGNLSANPGGSFNVPHGTTLNSTTVAINNNGAIATKLSTVGTTSNQGIWYGPGNGTGGVVANGPDIDTALWSDVSLSDSGRIILPVSSSAADGLYYRDTAQPNGVTFLTKPIGSTSYGGVRISPTNQVGYRATFSGDAAIERYNPTTNTNTVYASQSGNNYSFIATPWMNNAGVAASRVTNTGAGTANDDQVRRFNSDGSSSLVVQEGQVIPGWGTVSTVSGNVSMNEAGEVAVILRNTSSVSTLFKISADGSTFTQIATASTTNPTGGVRSFPGFTPVINNNGFVAFRAIEVNPADTTSSDAIFLGDGSGLVRVAYEREIVDTDLGVSQLGQENLTSTSFPAFAGNMALNDSNQVAFTAGVFPLGNNQIEYGTAIFIANPVVPEPAMVGLIGGSLALGLSQRRAKRLR